MNLIKYSLGMLSTILYGYLRWNVEGHWFTIPLLVVMLCLTGD